MYNNKDFKANRSIFRHGSNRADVKFRSEARPIQKQSVQLTRKYPIKIIKIIKYRRIFIFEHGFSIA